MENLHLDSFWAGYYAVTGEPTRQQAELLGNRQTYSVTGVMKVDIVDESRHCFLKVDIVDESQNC